MKHLKIALKLEGPESEKGLVKLDDFLRELSALQEALTSIDREMNNGKSTLYYRVVNLSHRSPAKVVIEPVLKKTMRGPRIGNRYGHMPQQVHHRFFETFHIIKEEKPARLKVSEPVLDAFASLLDGLGTEFVRGEIGNAKSKFKLDVALRERVEELLKPEYKSLGSVAGQLLGVNVARGNRFYIYPKVGPRSIACQFPESLFEQAQQYLRKNVRVYGTKYFRESTGFPFKIAEVTKIEILEPEQPFGEFSPSPIKIVGPPADELIREDREEWD